MRKLLLIIGCLCLSACSVKEERPRQLIKCWNLQHTEAEVYEGEALHAIGISTLKDGTPFMTFISAPTNTKVILTLENKVCAIAVE